MESQWLIDGFWKTPNNWEQLLILSIVLSKETILFPFCYILCDSKSEAFYNEVLQNVMSLLKQQISPKFLENLIVNCDFEQGLINSVQNIIKPKRIIGCFFHFSQCLWRRANELSLRKQDKKLMTMQLIMSCPFLCFVPKDKIWPLWSQIKENFSKFSFFDEFFSYFEKNCLMLKYSQRMNCKHLFILKNLLNKY